MRKPGIFIIATYIAPVSFGYIGCFIGVSNMLQNSGVPTGYARWLGAIVALAPLTLICIGLRYRKDLEVDSWDGTKALLGRLHDSNHVDTLCRCHATTRIQGWTLGCELALDTKAAFDYLGKHILSIRSEIGLEKEYSIKELYEFLEILAELDGSITAITNMGLFTQLKLIKEHDSQSAFGQAAGQLLRQFTTLHEMVERQCVDRLRESIRAVPIRARVPGNNEAVQQVIYTLGRVNGVLYYIMNTLIKDALEKTDDFYRMMYDAWKDDHQFIAKDECKPKMLYM